MARGNKQATAAKPKPQKPTAATSTKEASKNSNSKDTAQNVPLELHQKCLDLFERALKPGEDDTKILQQVKGHLYNRDFAAAFGTEDYLRVYASRWSPSRALGYLQVLDDVQEMLLEDFNHDRPYEALCLGGGAGAEVVALGGWMHQSGGSGLGSLKARFVDIAAWQKVVDDLHQAVTTAPELSKYASAAAKEANTAMVAPEAYSASFHQLDALAIESEQWKELLQDVNLVTLMFTLNELYSSSVPQTQKLLSHITSSLRAGSHLLVVDSPGSYSTVSINGAEKKYPMQWLLDLTLVGSSQRQDVDAPAKWEKLVADESKWFRLPQGLKYPIELENMRYQIHLYRRLPG